MGRLDRHLIVTTALRLLEDVGLDGLSTRRLAQELGVQSPALYWHFSSRRELLDAMAEAITLEAGVLSELRPGDDWTEWLAQRAHASRRAYLAHRDAARLHAGTRPSAAQLPSLEAQTAALVNSGLTAADALRALLAVSRYTIGWALEEQAHIARPQQPNPDRNLAEFPALRQSAAVLAQQDPDADFDFGLRALISGLQRYVEPRSTSHRR
jgi:TetR/AcrR family tetracycline transcriptional repressor